MEVKHVGIGYVCMYNETIINPSKGIEFSVKVSTNLAEELIQSLKIDLKVVFKVIVWF